MKHTQGQFKRLKVLFRITAAMVNYSCEGQPLNEDVYFLKSYNNFRIKRYFLELTTGPLGTRCQLYLLI